MKWIKILTISTYTTGAGAEMTRRLLHCEEVSPCANCHNANSLVSATVVTGTGRKPDVP